MAFTVASLYPHSSFLKVFSPSSDSSSPVSPVEKLQRAFTNLAESIETGQETNENRALGAIVSLIQTNPMLLTHLLSRIPNEAESRPYLFHHLLQEEGEEPVSYSEPPKVPETPTFFTLLGKLGQKDIILEQMLKKICPLVPEKILREALNIPDRTGETLLTIWAKRTSIQTPESKRILDLLVKAGADLTHQDAQGYNILTYAALKNDLKLIAEVMNLASPKEKSILLTQKENERNSSILSSFIADWPGVIIETRIGSTQRVNQTKPLKTFGFLLSLIKDHVPQREKGGVLKEALQEAQYWARHMDVQTALQEALTQASVRTGRRSNISAERSGRKSVSEPASPKKTSSDLTLERESKRTSPPVPETLAFKYDFEGINFSSFFIGDDSSSSQEPSDVFSSMKNKNENLLSEPYEIGNDSLKNTLLHEMVEKKDILALKKLLEQKTFAFDLNVTNQVGRTPLHLAAWGGDQEILEMLIQAGAGVNLTDNLDYSPLHFAVSQGHTECVKALIVSGAKVNITTPETGTKCDNTLIHQAVRLGNKKIVKYLIRAGARLDLKNRLDQTPLAIAKEEGHRPIVILLEQEIAKRKQTEGKNIFSSVSRFMRASTKSF